MSAVAEKNELILRGEQLKKDGIVIRTYDLWKTYIMGDQEIHAVSGLDPIGCQQWPKKPNSSCVANNSRRTVSSSAPTISGRPTSWATRRSMPFRDWILKSSAASTVPSWDLRGRGNRL